MECLPIKTRAFLPPKDDLFELFDVYVPTLQERDIFVVTSKVVSIGEGRCIPQSLVKDKGSLREQESEGYLKVKEARKNPYVVSLVHNALIPNAGIDESNGNGYMVLSPHDPWKSCRKIRSYLRRKHNIKDLGVVVVDSYGLPFRKGMLSISLGFSGIDPLRRYVGEQDIFGRSFHVENGNLVDAVAAMSGLVMGEGNECQPIAIVRDVPGMRYTNKDLRKGFFISPEQDMYYPLMKKFYEQ